MQSAWEQASCFRALGPMFGDSGSQGLRVEFKMKWSVPHLMLQVSIPKKHSGKQQEKVQWCSNRWSSVHQADGSMMRNVEWDHDFCECCRNPSTHMTRRPRQRKSRRAPRMPLCMGDMGHLTHIVGNRVASGLRGCQ